MMKLGRDLNPGNICYHTVQKLIFTPPV